MIDMRLALNRVRVNDVAGDTCTVAAEPIYLWTKRPGKCPVVCPYGTVAYEPPQTETLLSPEIQPRLPILPAQRRTPQKSGTPTARPPPYLWSPIRLPRPRADPVGRTTGSGRP
jgi:hypothetical protein